MKTIQLRRYELEPGTEDGYVAWWSRSLPRIRTLGGFKVEFAYLDRDRHQFVWAVSAPGDREDFKALEAAYMVSDARTEAFRDMAPGVLVQHLSFVDVVIDAAETERDLPA
ncbi:MAG: hypothetical protein QM638_03115 [Nocardioides sp.]|uniref:hypothetical protein n=1 Tax=Nocardioides sp. TaxID=35761 RepID=UPI0039E5691F